MCDIASQCKEFIRSQDAKSTVYNIQTAHNFFKRFAESRKECRPLEKIPPKELNDIVALALKDSVKSDSTFYEPEVLSTYFRAFQRYLHVRDYPVNILVDPSFDLSRGVLSAKRKELVKYGGGNKPNATRALTNEEEDILWSNGYFRDTNPDSLLNAVWWLLSIHYGFRARHEQRQLTWGDVKFEIDLVSGREYIVWQTERV